MKYKGNVVKYENPTLGPALWFRGMQHGGAKKVDWTYFCIPCRDCGMFEDRCDCYTDGCEDCGTLASECACICLLCKKLREKCECDDYSVCKTCSHLTRHCKCEEYGLS